MLSSPSSLVSDQLTLNVVDDASQENVALDVETEGADRSRSLEEELGVFQAERVNLTSGGVHGELRQWDVRVTGQVRRDILC